MKKNKIIAIVGMCGSGKSVLADKLVEMGWGYVRFGQITLDIVKERGLPLNEASEKLVREEVRREHGMAAYAKLNIPKFDEVLKSKNLIADNLLSWSEYKYLKDYYGDRLTVVAVFAPPELRYERISSRISDASDEALRNRPFTKEDAKQRDYNEIEKVEKGGPIAMADYVIINTGTKEEYLKQIDNVIERL